MTNYSIICITMPLVILRLTFKEFGKSLRTGLKKKQIEFKLKVR